MWFLIAFALALFIVGFEFIAQLILGSVLFFILLPFLFIGIGMLMFVWKTAKLQRSRRFY